MMTDTNPEGPISKRPVTTDKDWHTRIQRAKNAREQGQKAREGKPPVNPIPRTPLSLKHG